MNLSVTNNNSVNSFEDEESVRVNSSSNDIKNAVAFFVISFCNFFVLSIVLYLQSYSFTASLLILSILLAVFKLTPFCITFYFKYVYKTDLW